MTLFHLLQNSSLGPEEISCIIEAYENALLVLRVTNRPAAITESLAIKIIEIVKTGQRNPVLISARAIKELGITLPE
jgi:hypothetical protein